MVCLSSISQDNEFLLRFAAGVAGRLNRNWYAVHVQTLAEKPADGVDSVQKMLADTFTVARHLGATVFACKGDDIVKTILQFAGEYRAQHIIIGNSGRKLTWWQRIRGRRTIAERLISESRGISVMVLDTRNSGTPGNREPIVDHKTTLHPEKQSYHEAIDLVSNAGIIFWEQVTEKEKAIHQLLREIRLTDDLIDEDEALKSLLEREKQGGTYLGEDICIPHARLANLKKPVVAIGVSKAGILDGPSKNSACIMCFSSHRYPTPIVISA